MTYKAFVSSTFRDLTGHRQAVIATLRKAGVHVDPMEDWTADHREPKNVSQSRLDGCHLCILLVARRRGHVPEGASCSITQMEVAAALEQGVDLLPFLLTDDADWPDELDELDTDAGIREWRARLQERYIVDFFGTDPNSVEVAPALSRWISAQRTEAKTTSVSVANESLLEDVEAGSVIGVRNIRADRESPAHISVFDRAHVRRAKLGDIVGEEIGGNQGATTDSS